MEFHEKMFQGIPWSTGTEMFLQSAEFEILLGNCGTQL
jgi:hypothetical protein